MKQAIIIAIVSIALLVAGCGQTEGPVQDRTVPFIGGNIGLEVGLIDGMPPAAIYNNGMQFGVGLALKNEGEADVGPDTENPFVRVSLEGFRPSAFGLDAADMSQDLERPLLGAKKNFDGTILPGQFDTLTFEGLAYQDTIQGNLVQNIVAKTCYDYENWATAPLCFKDDVIENVEDICTLTGEKFPQNSGGPLHVRTLIQNPLGPYRVMISFVVEHVGTGDFYGRTDDEVCDPRLTNMNKYKVDVDVATEDPTMEIACSTLNGESSGTITMYQGAPYTLTCTLEAQPGARIYTEPVTINLRYRYGEMVVQPVVIQAVAHGTP